MNSQQLQDKSIWLEEYKIAHTQFQKFMELFIKLFMVYLGIQGLLIKFSLDENSNDQLKIVLSVFGVFCCIMLYACVIKSSRVAKIVIQTRELAAKKLQIESSSVFDAAYFGCRVYNFLNTGILVGWLFVLYQVFQPILM